MRATAAAQLSSQQRELHALRELSARLGTNPLLVQASTGNTSIKIGNSLWIKRSGKWLLDAEAEDSFLAVDLPNALHCFRKNVPIPETQAPASGRRASIETALHAVLPHKVVIHVHSINTIAWAVRKDGPKQLSSRLSGVAWEWIPYTSSGFSLAREIHRAVLSSPQTNVFVLANHGLVVCGESCGFVEQLLANVEARLAIEPRRAPAPQSGVLNRTVANSDWYLPPCAEVHALATDELSRSILFGGVLYPCQAMFFPETLVISGSNKDSPGRDTPPSFLLVHSAGVLYSKRFTPAKEQMLRGLANVVQRIESSAPLRYLTTLEVLEVLEGPKYPGAPDRDSEVQPTGGPKSLRFSARTAS